MAIAADEVGRHDLSRSADLKPTACDVKALYVSFFDREVFKRIILSSVTGESDTSGKTGHTVPVCNGDTEKYEKANKQQ